MLQKFLQVIVLTMVSLSVLAGRFDYATQLWDDISDESLTIVEVSGALKGSGIVVLLDNKPVIITNSHNLQGRKSARVKVVPYRFSYYNRETNKQTVEVLALDKDLSVLIDNPLYDFAILSLEEKLDENELELFTILGRMSGGFCQASSCKKRWYPNNQFVGFESEIKAILNGSRSKLPLIKGLEATLVDDQIIAGEKQKIISIPAYSRPGVSGGGYYFRGMLIGLLTKVSLIGTPETFATTLEEIGKQIASKPKDNVSAEWKNGELVVTVDGEEFVHKSASNAGGETGHGGGETGHGGGETGHGGGETGHGGGETGHGGGETGHGGGGPNANFWTLEFGALIGRPTIVTTWNPFVRRSSVFMLNNEEIAFFEVKGKYELPSMSNYRWNKRKGKKQKKFLRTEENLLLLEQTRHQPIDGASCGRVYNLNQKTQAYMVERGMQSTYADDGILFVLSDLKGQIPTGYKSPYPEPKKVFDIPANWIDREGWVRSWFTAARRTPGFILDVMRTPLRMAFGDKGPTGMHITIKDDLKEVMVKLDGKDLFLKRLETRSVTSILFSSEDQKMKAAILYDVNDLSRIERIYIQSGDGLIELGPCSNFAGVR